MGRIGGSGLVAVCLVACVLVACKDTTYTYPTDERPFVPREAGPDERKAFVTAAKKFEEKVVAAEAGNSKSWVVSPVGLFQGGIVLLNGSQDEAFKTISGYLSTDTDDPFSVTQGFSEFLGQTGPNVQVKSSVWAIQPVMMQSGFSNDMAEHFETDVLKLGSKGIYATRELDKWSQAASNRPADISLQTLMSTVVVSALKLDLKWDVPMTSVYTQLDRNYMDCLVATHEWDVVAGPHGNELVVPLEGGAYELRLETSEKVGKLADSTLMIPAITWSNSRDTVGLLQKMCADDLLKPGNDLRTISVELDDAHISLARQVISFTMHSLGIGGTPPTRQHTPVPEKVDIRFDKPFSYRLVHKESGLAILLGRFAG